MIAGAGAQDDLLCVMLLDTVTGRILHSHSLVSGHGPVNTAFYDNVGLVTFVDKMSFKTLAMALEVYDHSHPKIDAWNVLGVLHLVQDVYAVENEHLSKWGALRQFSVLAAPTNWLHLAKRRWNYILTSSILLATMIHAILISFPSARQVLRCDTPFSLLSPDEQKQRAVLGMCEPLHSYELDARCGNPLHIPSREYLSACAFARSCVHAQRFTSLLGS